MTVTKSQPTALQKTLILLAVCLSSAAMPLTFTGPAVALPAIGQTLGGSPIALNWVTNASILTFGSSLMAAGALADNYGRKRMFLIGIAAFAVFSLGLSLASDIVWFDLLRAAQGLAAACAFSAGMASLAQEFDGRDRTRAFSIVGTSFGVGLAFGPIVSGLMIDAFGWPSIFLLVVALALSSLSLATYALRESRDPDAGGLDWAGAIAFTVALSLFTYGVLQAPESGWGDPLVIAMLVGSILLFFVFWLVERRVKRPMLDLTLFRYPRFVGVQLLAASPAYAFVVLLILLPVRFVGIEGMDEIAAGRMMIALSAPLLFLPLVAGVLTRWFTPASICGTGLLVSAGGLLWLSQAPFGAASLAVLLPMLMIGTGISMPWGLMDGLAVSVVPKERAGMATGIFSTTRVAGEGVALAIVSALLSALAAAHLGSADPQAASTAAQLLVTGNLAAATSALPMTPAAGLVEGYNDAFSILLLILTAVTTLTALVVFLFLGRGAEKAAPDAVEEQSAKALCASSA